MFDSKWKNIPLSIKMERWRRHKITQKALKLRKALNKIMKETVGQDGRAIRLGILAAATADAEYAAEKSYNDVKNPITVDILRWIVAAQSEHEKRHELKELKKICKEII